MDEIIQVGIVTEMKAKFIMKSWFVKPVIILPKSYYEKFLLDAHYLNSITDISKCSWPSKALKLSMGRIIGSNIITSDLSSAYHHVPLTDEAQNLTSFFVGGRQCSCRVGIHGLKSFINFFQNLMQLDL